MKPKRRPSKSFWRFVLILDGVGILVWSGLEDKDATGAVAFGLITAIALTMTILGPRLAGMRRQIITAALMGSLIGASASVISAALMLFKDLRHAHPFPDFPPAMLLGVLERLPPWMAAGALAGLGLGLLHRLVKEQEESRA